MRVVSSATCRIGNSNLVQGRNGTVPRLPARQPFMRDHCFDDLVSNSHEGIQCRHWLLKDHGDIAAAQTTHLLFWRRKQLLSREPDLSTHTRLQRQQTQDRERRHRLPAPGFANQSKHFPGIKQEAQITDR